MHLTSTHTQNFEYETQEENIITSRKYTYIPTEEVENESNRGDTRTVKGTRKLHVAKSTDIKHEAIEYTNISCFCLACESKTGVCDNIEHMDPLSRATVALPGTAVAKQEDAPEQDEAEEEVEDEMNPIALDSGDYVAVKFLDKKKNIQIYAGCVLFIEENEVEVKFMKKLPGNTTTFCWPDKADRSWVDVIECITELPIPDIVNGRNQYTFPGYEAKIKGLMKDKTYHLK